MAASPVTLIEHALRAFAPSDGRGRNPLVPAAVRIERSRVRGGRGERGEQTALTLWFGEGPSLPGPSVSGRAVRVLARATVVVVGAAAMGAMGVLAAQRENERLAALRETPRLSA